MKWSEANPLFERSASLLLHPLWQHLYGSFQKLGALIQTPNSRALICSTTPNAEGSVAAGLAC